MPAPATHSFSVSLVASQHFAALSGDFNPLHIDPLAARRLLFGASVPHGIHILLAALDLAVADMTAAARITELRASFSAPAFHGAELTATVLAESEAKLRLTVRHGDALLQSATVQLARATGLDPVMIPDEAARPRAPRELAFDSAAGQSGHVPLRLDRRLSSSLFPALTRLIPAGQIALLLATTEIVGMEYPGRDSIYADLTLTFVPPESGAPAEVHFRPVRADKRLSLVRLALEGAGAAGDLTALFRPPPVVQQSAAQLAPTVGRNEFSRQQALVIGGSRGLGEVTAKLLAMGGADVWITFARGRAEAEAVMRDITSGTGRCGAFRFDVIDPPERLSEPAPAPRWQPTHLYYFATPSIQLRSGAPWSQERFLAYCSYYVSGVERSVTAVDRIFGTGKSPLTLFYPSTAFIEAPPSGAAEYAAAKAAGEVLCAALARRRPGLRIARPRLKALRTDQTNTVRGSKADDPVPAILDELRRVDA